MRSTFSSNSYLPSCNPQAAAINYMRLLFSGVLARRCVSTAEQGAEHFMAKWIIAEKTTAGLRLAVVCPNLTGRTKERIAQSKGARASSLAFIDYSHKWRELVPSGRLVCRCHDVFLWCYICFVLLRFRLYAFVEAEALRSIVIQYSGAPIATRVSFSFLGDVAFSEYFLYHFRFLFIYMESNTYVLCFRMVFSYLVTTGWIFDISLFM